MNKALKYSFGLIAIYLVVSKGTQAGKLMTSGARGGRDIIKAFQGR